MKIAVVSDTHGHIENTARLIQQLDHFEIEAVLHCGDIGTSEIVTMFASWPTHFVFGNCDHDHVSLRHTIKQAGQHCHDLFGELELGGRSIALLHSHDAERFIKVINANTYDMVCYGHTHCAEQHLVGKTLVLNPGAMYRADPHKFAIVDLDSMTAEHFELQ